MSSANSARAKEIVATFLQRVNKGDGELTDELSLYGEGLELDSLEVAELSALLEDELGTDPFSTEDVAPERLGDIYAYYDRLATA